MWFIINYVVLQLHSYKYSPNKTLAVAISPASFVTVTLTIYCVLHVTFSVMLVSAFKVVLL